MKKNTVKKLNTVFVSIISILLILTVFFCSFSSSISVFASELFPSDCPDCADGTCSLYTTTDCTASGCVDGLISTNVLSSCERCDGESVIFSVEPVDCFVCGADGWVTCSSCNGNGYYVEETSSDDDGWYQVWVYGCEACGGSSKSLSYSYSSGDGNTPVTTAVTAFLAKCTSTPTIAWLGIGGEYCDLCNATGTTIYSECYNCSGLGYTQYTVYAGYSSGTYYDYYTAGCEICGGTGEYCYAYSKTTAYTQSLAGFVSLVSSGEASYGSGMMLLATEEDCPNCDDGTAYSTVVTNCSVCGGDGEIMDTIVTTCPTCNGDGYLYSSLDNISTIPTIITTEDGEVTITFTYTEIGDVGDLEFIWYLNDTAYKVTDSSSITLSGLPSSV